MENIQKLLYEMQADFICACKNTRTNAPRGRITRNHSSACARYNLQIYLASRLYSNHACPQNHVNSQNKEGALGQSEC